MRETGIHAESEQSVQFYKCSSGIFTQQGSTVVYKEKQINLHNMESVHTRILTKINKNFKPTQLLSETEERRGKEFKPYSF